MARNNRGGLFGKLFQRIKGKIEEIRTRPKQPVKPQPKQPTQSTPSRPQPTTPEKTTPVKPTQPKPSNKPKPKPQEKEPIWNMTPEEKKFASMTVDEVLEYQNKHKEVSIAPSSNFFADSVIANFRDNLKHFPDKAEPLLNSWLDRLINEYGSEAVADMLQQGAENGIILTERVAYSNDKLQGYIAEMLDYLPDMTDWYKAEVLDSMEEWADIE